MSVLEPASPDFARHDSFLQILSGLAALATRAQVFFERAVVKADRQPLPHYANDPILMGVLGLVSLQRKVLAALRAACDGAPEPRQPTTTREEARMPAELLR